MKIGIKTQTPRSTSYRQNLSNGNLFCGDCELGIITTMSWGRFEEREEPLITITVDGKNYEISLSDFFKRLIQATQDGKFEETQEKED